MDYVFLAVMGSLIGTVSIVFLYIYLYALYRERYMGIWAVSWLVLLSRYVLFDSGLLSWKESIIGLAAYQMLIIISVSMFIWGTYRFINKPLSNWWLYCAIFISILSAMLNILISSLTYKLLPCILFGSFIGIRVGLAYICHLKLQGIGRLIAGYAYILWSLMSLVLPFAIDYLWVIPWGYSIGGILRLVIAISTLLVYFEKTRVDLIDKETQYRLITENAVDVIYHFQLLPEARIQYISPSILLNTGYTPEEYYADNAIAFNLVFPEDHSLLDSFINNLPTSINSPLTLRIVRKDKTTLWIEQKCVPLYDEKGHLVAIEGIIRDITERKRLEKMSLLFDRMNLVGSMAATVAHEIRNPMTTVRGYLQILGRKKEYQTDKDKFKLMIEEIDRANIIIREYLSLSREKLMSFKKSCLNDVIQALFPLIQADATSSKVYATLDLTTIPELWIDENEIRQVLLNLVRNSIEAMPSGGNLVIGTFPENNKVVLYISDQGSGIPSHILDNLGTPFITTKDTGTGLGLSICYQIVHRHNASIKISTSDGGTTFFIYFNLPLL